MLQPAAELLAMSVRHELPALLEQKPLDRAIFPESCEQHFNWQHDQAQQEERSKGPKRRRPLPRFHSQRIAHG